MAGTATVTASIKHKISEKTWGFLGCGEAFPVYTQGHAPDLRSDINSGETPTLVARSLVDKCRLDMIGQVAPSQVYNYFANP